jgi:hypothetical protein
MSHAKQVSTKRKRSINAVPVLSAAGLSLSLASGASAAIGRPAADTPTPKTGISHEITLCEEEISDVSLATFSFRDEDVWGCGGFAQELAQRPTFPCRYRMHAGIPSLGPAHMQSPGGEVDVVPAQRYDLRGSEAVAVGNQDRRGVPVPRAVLLGGLDEPLDLSLG